MDVQDNKLDIVNGIESLTDSLLLSDVQKLGLQALVNNYLNSTDRELEQNRLLTEISEKLETIEEINATPYNTDNLEIVGLREDLKQYHETQQTTIFALTGLMLGLILIPMILKKALQ